MSLKKTPVDDKNKKINNPDTKEQQPNQEQPKETMPQTVGDAVSDDTKSIIDVTLEADEPQGFNTKLDEIKDKSKYIGRTTEKGFVNEEYGSSMALRENGQISLAAGKQAQMKMNPSGTVDILGLEIINTSNRIKYYTDELVINDHKLNPNLWELTGFKSVPLQDNQFATVGNFTMAGYVLVRAWDRQLGRYMMIRRPARIAPFGPRLNVADIHPALKIDDPLKVKEDILALSKKGYQVNAKIEDKASRIGKEGLKRDDAKYGTYGADKDGGSGSYSGDGAIASLDPVSLRGNSTAQRIWNFFKDMGYDDNAVAGIMGNMQQESSLSTGAVESDAGYGTGGGGALTPGTGFGLVQWTDAPRQALLQQIAAKLGKSPYDLEAQLATVKYELQTTHSGALPQNMNGKTIEGAVSCFTGNFEYQDGDGREGIPVVNHVGRVGYAQSFYNAFAKK